MKIIESENYEELALEWQFKTICMLRDCLKKR